MSSTAEHGEDRHHHSEHDSHQDWERRVLSRLDPTARHAPPAQGSVRYTAILEAAMNLTTSKTRIAQAPSAAPATTPPADIRSARRRSPRRWVLSAAAAAGLAVAATVSITVFPGGSSTAYAAWTPAPQQPSAQQALDFATKCTQSWESDVPAGGVSASDVILSDVRGPYAMTLMRKGESVALCEDIDPTYSTTWQELGQPVAVPQGQVLLETMGSVGEGENVYSSIVGQLGEGVDGVDVVLPDGTTVRASTAGGRWAAWWPGASGAEAEAVRVVVHTAGGEQRFTPTELFADA